MVAAVVLLGLLGACGKAENEAAKRRVFAREEISSPGGQDVSFDPASRADLSMGAGEAARRLGPHSLQASASFEWTMDGKKVALSETRTVRLGGAGSFHASVDNDGDQGFDVLKTGGRVFARSKYLPWRERVSDHGQAERLRDETYAGFAAFAALCDWKLALVPDGHETIGGRAAKRFKLAESARPLGAEVVSAIPSIDWPSDGPDRAMRRRLEFESGRTLKSLAGRLWVDEASGVILKAEAQATLTLTPAPEEPPPAPRLLGELPGVESDAGADAGAVAPPPPPKPAAPAEVARPATLMLSLKSAVAEVQGAHAAPIEPPRAYLPDEGRPHGVAEAIERFWKSGAVQPKQPEE